MFCKILITLLCIPFPVVSHSQSENTTAETQEAPRPECLHEAPAEQCNITCQFLKHNIFETPTSGVLDMDMPLCNISLQSTSPQWKEPGLKKCSLPISKLYGTLNLDRNNEVILYSKIMCHLENKGLYVHFIQDKPKGTTFKNSIISYLRIVNCSVSWQSIALFGNSVDLRVLILEDWLDDYLSGLVPLHHEIIYDGMLMAKEDRNSDIEAPIRGLQNVGSLRIMNTQTKPLPSLIHVHKWPKMAEIQLEKVSFGEMFSQRLPMSMPKLQTLSVVKCNLTQPFASFPWYQHPFELPRNLSRIPMFNEQYASVYGIQIESNKYKRDYTLKDNKIPDLSTFQFHGFLSRIDLSFNSITFLGDATFRNISGLQNILLNNNEIHFLPAKVFHQLNQLTEINLEKNKITAISTAVFQHTPSLRKINLNHNKLEEVLQDTFTSVNNLEYLEMSNNNLLSVSDGAIDANLASLKEVSFVENKLTVLPTWAFLVRSLKSSYFSYNKITFDTFHKSLDPAKLPAEIIMSNNHESSSTYDFPYKPVMEKTISLTNNFIEHMDLTRLDEETKNNLRTIMTFFNVDIANNPIDCNCGMYEMYKYILSQRKIPRDPLFSMPLIKEYYFTNWVCISPPEVTEIPLVDVPDETFKCTKNLTDCPEKCTCYVKSVDSGIIVDCREANLTNLPNKIPLASEQLIVKGGNIKKLCGTMSYLSTLLVLDVSHNYINDICPENVAAISKLNTINLDSNKLVSLPKEFKDIRSVKMSLRGNIFRCDCNAIWMKSWLLQNYKNILDLDEILCATGKGQGQILIQVPDSDFICPEELERTAWVVVGVLSGLFILILIAIGLTHRFRKEIKVILYMKFKWHPWDKGDDSIDGKDFDAFVSYSGDDYRWVCTVLRPQLECEYKYHLCVHDRDFLVGDTIFNNISQAVKRSRRMIMVLSKTFLKSQWCMLEFRAAHQKVLKDRTNYLIVILFEDVSTEDLDDELKLYLKTNTYLNLSNSWFWQKLIYAMPQTPIATLRPEVAMMRDENLPMGPWPTTGLLNISDRFPHLNAIQASMEEASIKKVNQYVNHGYSPEKTGLDQKPDSEDGKANFENDLEQAIPNEEIVGRLSGKRSNTTTVSLEINEHVTDIISETSNPENLRLTVINSAPHAIVKATITNVESTSTEHDSPGLVCGLT